MEPILCLVLVILLLSTLYHYLTWTFNFWEKQGIPYDKNTIPGLGNISSVILLQENLANLCAKYYNNQNHSMFGFYHLTTPALLIRDPELVKSVLLTNFSNFSENQLQLASPKDALLECNPIVCKRDTWKDNRSTVSNAFSNTKLKQMFPFIENVTSNMERYLKDKVTLHFELELKKFFNIYTGEIATFGIGFKGHEFKEDESSQEKWFYKKILDEIFQNPILTGGYLQVIFLHLPKLAKLMNLSVLSKRVNNRYRDAFRKIFSDRKRENIAGNDYLQIVGDYVRKRASVADEETTLAAYSLSFTTEFYETSAMTLSFTVFQIAAHAQVQEKVRREIKCVLERHEGQLNYEGLKEMTYLEQVMNEAMRLNHVTGIFMKICTSETELKGSDGLWCTMKPGNIAIISAYGLQMDEDYFPDPEKFDPDRFGEEEKTRRHRFTFLPFGEGPRICVGMRMGIMMMKLAIATILRNFSLELSPKAPFPLVRNNYSFLSAFNTGLWVVLKPLRDCEKQN